MKATVQLLFVAGVVACASPPAVTGEGHAEEHHDDEEEEEEQPPRRVALDPHVVERTGIKIQAAQTHLLLGALEVPAEVQVNHTRVAHVAPLVRGRLTTVDAHLGDTVAKGDVLATMQSTDLGSIRAALKQAQARKRVADAALERKKRLAASGVTAKKELLAAQGEVDKAAADVQAARAELSVYGAGGRGKGAGVALRSPLAGVVLERHAIEGEVVDSATTLFVVADLSRIWVIGSVFERDVSRVAKGLPAEVSVIAAPGQSWRGVVDYVDSALDPESRTVAIRVELDNLNRVLRPGFFGTIAIGEPEAEGREVLAVPDEALQNVGGRMVVFSEAAPSVFEPLTVIPGARAHGLVEIKDGLQVGTPIVIAGSFALKSKLLEASLGEGHEH